jgi:hypothetical protein
MKDKGSGWVVVARVGGSKAAKRTDSCGDMEQLELMEFILVSEHETKKAADEAAAAKRARKDGWRYVVMSRHDYTSGAGSPAPKAA